MSYTAGNDDGAVWMLNGSHLSLLCDGRIIKSTGNIEQRQAAQPVAG